MILDANGRPVKRAIGFIAGFVPARKSAPPADALYVVGFEAPKAAEEEDEEKLGGSGLRHCGTQAD